MKKLIFLTILSLALIETAASQYRAYHKEIFEKNEKISVKSFNDHISVCNYGLSRSYLPQRFQGMQVITMNRTGGVYDDVYFIDKNGNTQYHTIKQTAPLNTFSRRDRYGVFDSSNPSEHSYQSFGHALVDGLATLLAGKLID